MYNTEDQYLEMSCKDYQYKQEFRLSKKGLKVTYRGKDSSNNVINLIEREQLGNLAQKPDQLGQVDKGTKIENCIFI